MLRSGFSSQSKGGELGRADGFCDGPAYEPREERSFEVEMAERVFESGPSFFRPGLLLALVEVKRWL